jgi:hypothetical protein
MGATYYIIEISKKYRLDDDLIKEVRKIDGYRVDP